MPAAGSDAARLSAHGPGRCPGRGPRPGPGAGRGPRQLAGGPARGYAAAVKPAAKVWLLLGLALAARVLLLGWDSGLLSPHPDERQVAFVAERMHGLASDPGFYAYGQLHFTAVRAVAAALGGPLEYAGLLRGGRILSLAASLAALGLAWLLAWRAWGRRAGLVVLALGAMVPLDLEQAHFATVEAHHAFWVIAALAAAYWLARRGTLPAAVVAGAAWGASLSVKVASLPLALPLAVAVVLTVPRRRWLGAGALGLALAAGALAAFAAGQPSAFPPGRAPFPTALALLGAALLLRAAASRSGWGRLGLGVAALGAVALAGALLPGLAAPYLRGVGEQLAMATGRVELPYTRVYRHTTAGLYPLRQLGLWGLGPALLLGALAAVGSALLRLWRGGRSRPGRSSTLLAILLAWVLPVAVRLATLPVKYLRYWEPLVLPLVLLAAWWLARPDRGRALRRVVVAATLLWGVTYLWGFAAPHPHATAASWVGRMAGPGETVAFESWDESLPLPPPVHSVTLPSYDLPDDAAKAQRWCATLARADWVVLTSNRVRHTVLANPETFPVTAELYRMLLSGEAGFRPLCRIDRGPRLFALRAPVQGADESFVNYDFPRVVVLRRVAAVPVAELVGRALVTEGSAPGWPELERLLVEPLPELPPSPTLATQTAAVLSWAVLLALLGAAAWLLVGWRLAAWPDGGAGLSLTTGWIGGAWVMWLGVRSGLWRAGPATATAVALGLVVVAVLAGWPRRRLLARLWHRRRRARRLVLGIAAAVGLLFLAARLGNPAIYWGEKPMDLTFLEAFVRSPQWPPGEPWLAGEPLHYYYLGEALAAAPILATGADPAVGYNLMAATLPALGAAVLAALGLAAARRPRAAAAWLAPGLVLLTGNLAWPFLLNLARQGRWFDLWWATSRVIPGFAIDEYPLWTALFADLHAHFLAQPVLLAALAWGWVTVAARRRWLAPAALLAVTAGVLVATNPWDAIVLAGALAVALVAAPRPLAGLARLVGSAVGAAVSVAPFWWELAAWARVGVGGLGVGLNRADFAPAWAVLRHLGVFLLPLTALAVYGLSGSSLLVLVAAVVAAGVGWSMGSSAAALALGTAVLFTGGAVRARDRGARLGWALAALAMLLVAGCERFTLLDRMNTLFKVYNGVWIALAAALALHLLRAQGIRRRLLLGVWLPLEMVALANLPLGLAQGWLQPRMPSPRPTLDGQAYLATAEPDTAFLVRALEGVAWPGDVVAEAAGPPYQDYARIAMNTGLPTVVGWEWHLQQRGQDPAEVAQRRAELEILYAGDDPEARRAVLDRFDVRWVVVGRLERETYDLLAPDPLAGVPGVVPVARDGDAVLYLVR